MPTFYLRVSHTAAGGSCWRVARPPAGGWRATTTMRWGAHSSSPFALPATCISFMGRLCRKKKRFYGPSYARKGKREIGPRAEERGRRQSCVHTCFCLPSLVPFTSPRVRERQRQQLGWPPPPPAAQLPRASSSSGPLPATTTTTTRTHHHSMPAPSLPFPSLPYLPCKIEHPNPKWSYYLATCMPIWSNRKCIHVLWRLTSIWCTCVHSCPSLGPPCTCFFILYAFRHALISTVEHKGYKYDFLLVLFCLRQFMFRLL